MAIGLISELESLSWLMIKKENIRGSMLIDTIITRIIEMTNEVITINTSNDVRDQIYKHLNEDSNQFNAVRKTEITQALI